MLGHLNIKLCIEKLLMISVESLLLLSQSPVTTNLVLTVLTLLSAVGLALVHLFGGKLRFLEVVPRSRWLSLAGGASIAYVFVHLLPELSERQEIFEQTDGLVVGFLEHHVYLVALIGLVAFYGLEKVAISSRKQKQAAGEGDSTEVSVFWLHISSFAAYNVLIGYLLVHREEPGIWSLFAFFLALGFHFFVNDYSLRQHHKSQYHQVGRWILAGAVFCGWAIGQATEITEPAIAVLFAFLAGGIVLNVIKEELPEERLSTFWAFVLGTVVYTALLLAG